MAKVSLHSAATRNKRWGSGRPSSASGIRSGATGREHDDDAGVVGEAAGVLGGEGRVLDEGMLSEAGKLEVISKLDEIGQATSVYLRFADEARLRRDEIQDDLIKSVPMCFPPLTTSKGAVELIRSSRTGKRNSEEPCDGIGVLQRAHMNSHFFRRDRRLRAQSTAT
jgi:hypothetical protein